MLMTTQKEKLAEIYSTQFGKATYYPLSYVSTWRKTDWLQSKGAILFEPLGRWIVPAELADEFPNDIMIVLDLTYDEKELANKNGIYFDSHFNFYLISSGHQKINKFINRSCMSDFSEFLSCRDEIEVKKLAKTMQSLRKEQKNTTGSVQANINNLLNVNDSVQSTTPVLSTRINDIVSGVIDLVGMKIEGNNIEKVNDFIVHLYDTKQKPMLGQITHIKELYGNIHIKCKSDIVNIAGSLRYENSQVFVHSESSNECVTLLNGSIVNEQRFNDIFNHEPITHQHEIQETDDNKTCSYSVDHNHWSYTCTIKWDNIPIVGNCSRYTYHQPIKQYIEDVITAAKRYSGSGITTEALLKIMNKPVTNINKKIVRDILFSADYKISERKIDGSKSIRWHHQ